MNDAFLYRDLPVVDKRVHRLGLVFNRGIDAAGVETALDAGINYLFWNKIRKNDTFDVVKAALHRDRERYVFAGGGGLGFYGGGVRMGVERLLKAFDVDYVDVFHLFWLGRMSAFTDGVVKELVKLREEGLVHALGVSIHDRPRAGRLAVESPLDLLMIRYNAAHPGAEEDIFPRYAERRPITVAYTATSWGKLLQRPKGWDGPIMSPGQCYRFCLSSPHVDVVLCGADSTAHLTEDLAALLEGPLVEEEDAFVRRFGHAVHG